MKKKLLSQLKLEKEKHKELQEEEFSGNDYSNKVIENYPDEKVVIICADIEDQIMNLDKSEQVNFMNEVGMEKTGLNQLIKTGYDLLNLIAYFIIYLKTDIFQFMVMEEILENGFM